MSSPSFHTKLHSISERPSRSPETVPLKPAIRPFSQRHEPEVGVVVGDGELDPEADAVDGEPERLGQHRYLVLERAARRLARLGRRRVVGIEVEALRPEHLLVGVAP